MQDETIIRLERFYRDETADLVYGKLVSSVEDFLFGAKTLTENEAVIDKWFDFVADTFSSDD